MKRLIKGWLSEKTNIYEAAHNELADWAEMRWSMGLEQDQRILYEEMEPRTSYAPIETGRVQCVFNNLCVTAVASRAMDTSWEQDLEWSGLSSEVSLHRNVSCESDDAPPIAKVGECYQELGGYGKAALVEYVRHSKAFTPTWDFHGRSDREIHPPLEGELAWLGGTKGLIGLVGRRIVNEHSEYIMEGLSGNIYFFIE